MLFTDKNNDGLIRQSLDDNLLNEVLSFRNYSPFGLELGGSHKNLDYQNGYKFGGKELDNFTGLTDFGRRNLDAPLARFTTQDRFSEKYFGMSTMGYAAGNPINLVDINGDSIFVDKTGTIIRNDKTDNLVFLNHKNEIISLGEIGGEINANIIYDNLLKQNIKEAKETWNPITFRNNVKNKGKWDLKNNKKTIYGLANDGKTKFKFKNELLESQDIGNQHFGATALAYGLFPNETFILQKAGEAQMAAGTSKTEWQPYKITTRGVDYSGQPIKMRELQSPYGDDPRDQKWIRNGFNYYKNEKK